MQHLNRAHHPSEGSGTVASRVISLPDEDGVDLVMGEVSHIGEAVYDVGCGLYDHSGAKSLSRGVADKILLDDDGVAVHRGLAVSVWLHISCGFPDCVVEYTHLSPPSSAWWASSG